VDDDLDRARMQAHQLAMPDFHDFLNAVSPSPTTKHGHVSFDVRWRGHEHDRKRIRDKTFGFVGEYVPTEGHIDFRVSDDESSVIYTSQPHGQTTVSGGIGHERNGVFFS
jgi:hypothetical protein